MHLIRAGICMNTIEFWLVQINYDSDTHAFISMIYHTPRPIYFQCHIRGASFICT